MRLVPTLALVAALSIATAAQAAGEQPKPSNAASPGDKMICKRFTKIGTLAGSYRTCKTKKEWDRENSNIRTAGQSGYCGPRETIAGTGTETC